MLRNKYTASDDANAGSQVCLDETLSVVGWKFIDACGSAGEIAGMSEIDRVLRPWERFVAIVNEIEIGKFSLRQKQSH